MALPRPPSSSAAAEQASASTEELSAQVEEVVASASTLRDLATSLKESVSVFTTSGTRKGVSDSTFIDEANSGKDEELHAAA